jgi:hypothetical protein
VAGSVAGRVAGRVGVRARRGLAGAGGLRGRGRLAALAPASQPASGPALVPGEVVRFAVELPDTLRQFAGAAAVQRALVEVALPTGFDAARAWPVLLVNATSDPGYQSSRALAQAYRQAATAAGWVVVAADPEPAVSQEDDRLTLRFALASAALAALQMHWAQADEAPLALAGFSGGAKYSGWLAAMFARQGRRVAGVYLAGINQEPLKPRRAVRRLRGPLRRLPVFRGGAKDRIATPAQHRLQAELWARVQPGAARVLEGSHVVDPEPLPRAWPGSPGWHQPATSTRVNRWLAHAAPSLTGSTAKRPMKKKGPLPAPFRGSRVGDQ